MSESLEQRARRLLANGNTAPGVELVRFLIYCSIFGLPFIAVAERHGDLLKLVRSELPDGGGAPAGAWAALGTFRFNAYGWPGCGHCGATEAPAHGHGCFWWCDCTQCNGLFQCAGNRNCSDLQTSGVGIANIRPIGARSLQMALGHKPTITATEPRLIANGIANIRSVRTLIATQRWEAIPTSGFVILPLWSNDWPPSCKEIRRYDLKLYLDRITDFLA